jgi:hypothetical protein
MNQWILAPGMIVGILGLIFNGVTKYFFVFGIGNIAGMGFKGISSFRY